MKNDPAGDIELSRRSFLKTSGKVIGTVGLASLATATQAADSWPPSGHSLLARGDVVLFQGDSITDAGRSREPAKMNTPNNHAGLGNGYAWLAASELLVSHPEDGFKIFNRGISGHKVFQLADRWQADCLDLKPNLLSILIGVNDYWHTLDPKSGYKGTVEIYERDFQALLERTKKALPKVKLVICEPFVLRCGAVNEHWFPEFDRYRAAARRVAKSQHAVFVPFQTMFDEALKYAAPDTWAGDGVHPTAAGASLMAYFWLKAVTGK
jgi:lysophospholipase L1-like esterase